jgi:hypothetical protein
MARGPGTAVGREVELPPVQIVEALDEAVVYLTTPFHGRIFDE